MAVMYLNEYVQYTDGSNGELKYNDELNQYVFNTCLGGASGHWLDGLTRFNKTQQSRNVWDGARTA